MEVNVSRKKEYTRKVTFYEKYIKRPFDFCCALLAIVVLSPVMLVIAFLVWIKLGSPIILNKNVRE